LQKIYKFANILCAKDEVVMYRNVIKQNSIQWNLYVTRRDTHGSYKFNFESNFEQYFMKFSINMLKLLYEASSRH